MSENEQNSSENKEIEEISEGVNPEEEEIEQPDSSEESNQEVEEKPSGTEKSETSQKEPEEPEQSWEEKLEDLDEPLSPEERKQRKKEEKKLKKERKRKEMAQKTQEVIDKEFLNIFNSRVLVYTIIFFAVVLANFILWTVKTDENALLMQWWQITITLSFIIGSALMLRLSRYPKIYDAQFADKEKLQKIVMYIFMIAVGFAITFLYYKYTDSIENGPLADPENGDQITIDALRYQKLFSTVLMVVFFGWNVIQIFFIRNAIDTFSLKPEISFSISNENVPLKNLTRKSNIYNFVLLIIPIVFHLVFTWLFIYMDTPQAWEPLEEMLSLEPTTITEYTHKFTPEVFFWKDYAAQQAEAGIIYSTLEFGDMIAFNFGYFRDVWWANEPLRYIFVWAMIVLGILVLTVLHQVKLMKKSNLNETPNVFSGWWYFWFWLVMWFKFFPIIKTAISLNENVAVELAWYDLALDIVVDLVLMVFTILLVIRSFGMKLKDLDKPWLKEYNGVFILFIFAISYFAGQMVILTGGVVANMNQLKLTTNIVVVIVNLVFYFWYTGWIMERKGFNRKQSYTLYETKDLLISFAQRVRGSLLDTIENREIITTVLNDVMLENKIALKGTVDEQDAMVSSLDFEEEETDSRIKLDLLKKALDAALIDENNYNKAVNAMENMKQQKAKSMADRDKLQEQVNRSQHVVSDYEAKKVKFESMNSDVEALKTQINTVKSEIQAIKIPELPQPKVYDTEKYSEDQIASLKAEEKANSDKIQKEITELKAKKQGLESKLNQLNTEFGTKSNELSQAKASLDEANNRYLTFQKQQQELSTNINLIEKLIKGIEGKEKDIEILEQRKKESEALVEASKQVVETAEKEVKVLIELEKEQRILDETKANVSKAADRLELANRKLSEAKSTVDSLPTVSESEKIIESCKKEISEKNTRISEFEKEIGPLTEEEERRKQKYENSKKVLSEEEDRLSALKKDQKESEQAMAKARDVLGSYEATDSEKDIARKNNEELKGKLDDIKTKLADQTSKVEIAKQEAAKAEKDYSSTKSERKEKQDDNKRNVSDVESLKQRISKSESNIDARKKAESNLSSAEKECKEVEAIYQKAAKSLEAAKSSVDSAQMKYDDAKSATALDNNIAKAEAALKKAHQTFKDAVRSAELNVKVCEQKLEEAKKQKAEQG